MARSYQAEIAKLADLATFDVRAFVADAKADQDCCDFVLALAVAFNDIKDLLLADHLLLGEVPEDRLTPSRELGAFAGLHFHFFRVLLGVLHELLYLIKNDATVLDNPLLRALVKRLPKTARKSWEKLVASSVADASRDPDIAFLVKARNTVAYHYGKRAIGQGYRRAFSAGADQPFISRGTTIASTRFFFADRAAHSYLQQVFGERGGAIFPKTTQAHQRHSRRAGIHRERLRPGARFRVEATRRLTFRVHRTRTRNSPSRELYTLSCAGPRR